MPRAEPLSVAVIYGGPSVEHDVSIITALQVMSALDVRHRVVPVYIDHDGAWYTGERLRALETYSSGRVRDAAAPTALELATQRLIEPRAAGLKGLRRSAGERIDVAVPACHGTLGEDGALQGLLELARLPYVGSDVGASAVAMNKSHSKAVLAAAGLPVVDGRTIGRHDWRRDADAVVEEAARALGTPVYVKPMSLGSSIGVSRCETSDELRDALELAFELDAAALVEPSVEDAIEINCAVLGRPGAELEASVCEQPVRSEEFLSFDDKYVRGGKPSGMKGAERIVPAPLPEDQTLRIRELAKRTFAALGCAGVARIDFLVRPGGEIFVNEANTIPGSFSFYLWEESGLAFHELLDRLIDLAFEQFDEQRSTTRTFASTLLTHAAGAKHAPVA